MGRSATVEKAEASEKEITATTPPDSLHVFACSFSWIVLRLVAEAVQSLAGESVRIYVEGYAVVGAAVSDVPPGYTKNCTCTCTWKSILILNSFLFGLDEGGHSEYFSSVFLQHRSGGTHWCVCTVECDLCMCTFILHHILDWCRSVGFPAPRADRRDVSAVLVAYRRAFYIRQVTLQKKGGGEYSSIGFYLSVNCKRGYSTTKSLEIFCLNLKLGIGKYVCAPLC